MAAATAASLAEVMGWAAARTDTAETVEVIVAVLVAKEADTAETLARSVAMVAIAESSKEDSLQAC